MARTRGSFPFPVVDGSDDVNSVFEAYNVTIHSPIPEQVTVAFDLQLNDADLHRRLVLGSVVLSVSWRCNATYQSGIVAATYKYTGPETMSCEIQLEQQKLFARVDLVIPIVAAENIPDYYLKAQNPDYLGATFSIRRGDVLAVARSLRFNVQKWYDPLNPPLEAIFSVEENPDIKKGFQVDLTRDQQVGVLVSAELWTALQEVRGRPWLQISLLIFPALVFTLSELQNPANIEELEGRAWTEDLRSLLRSTKTESKDAIVQAQAIFDNPVLMALQAEQALEGDYV